MHLSCAIRELLISMDRILFLDNSIKNDLYDEVCKIDEDEVTVIARSEACEILAFKLKNRPVWGIQPHFEMGIVEGLKFIEWVQGDGIPDKQSFFISAENYPKDSGWIIPLMKAFHNARPL